VLLSLSARTCPECGCVFEWASAGSMPDTVSGELEEIDAVAVARQRRWEVMRARTLEDLQAIGRARGYKMGWAYHVWRERQMNQGMSGYG
jgi:DNA repair protein RadD